MQHKNIHKITSFDVIFHCLLNWNPAIVIEKRDSAKIAYWRTVFCSMWYVWEYSKTKDNRTIIIIVPNKSRTKWRLFSLKIIIQLRDKIPLVNSKELASGNINSYELCVCLILHRLNIKSTNIIETIASNP